jgi:hydroxymethylpyrimidine kinase/phosphomethylpyrimidine kinase/thiamine-phosphate diphosphorylase
VKVFEGVELHAGDKGGLRCWLDTQHARGWLTPAPGALESGTQERFAAQFAVALAEGFVAADAAVLAMMKTCHPNTLPLLSWGEQVPGPAPVPAPARRLDIYAIVDSAERMKQVLAAGVRTVQLRIKTPERAPQDWQDSLSTEIERCVAACQTASAELFVNDHWQLAARAGARGVHLGQEDLLALGEAGRAELLATGMALGVSSHSLWELCRARTLGPRYIACGPVWPTLTKAMPWRAQGLDNLAWWCAMAGPPVVAIGGILGGEQVFEAARAGADGICIVRGLGERPQAVVPALRDAMEHGRAAATLSRDPPEPPHPSLAAD